MNKIKNITKNTFVLLISQSLVYILSFFYLIYTANYLGAGEFGILSFALSFSGIFVVLTDLGLNMLMTREISRDNSVTNKYLTNIMLIKIILAFLTLFLISIIINLFNYPKDTIWIVYIISISIVLTPFYEMFFFIFQAFQKMEIQAVGMFFYNLILLIGAVIAILFNLSIFIFALNYVIASIFELFFVIIIFKWKFRNLKIFNKNEIDFEYWKILLKSALPLSLFVISTAILFRIDSVILSIFIGNEAVGVYTAAYRLMEATTVIPVVFMAALYPILSNQYVSSKNSLHFSYKKSFKYLIILAMPIAFGVTILSNDIINLIYNSSYESSILILQILIWTIPFFYITYLLKIVLISIDKQVLLSKIIFLCMIINLILNLILIPYFSFYAASLINVFTESIFFIIAFHYISELYPSKIKKTLLKTIISCLIMGFLLLYLNSCNINLFIKILISIITYFVILIFLKTFSSEDIEIIKKLKV